MATLTVKKLNCGLSAGTYSGVDISDDQFASAASGGDQFAVGDADRTLIIIDNQATAGSVNVTVASQVNCDQGHDHDVVFAVAAGKRRTVAVFKGKEIKDGSNNCQITYSDHTNIKVLVCELDSSGR